MVLRADEDPVGAERPAELSERDVHLQRIEAAVRRARRVECHSLARDQQQLAAWAQQTAQVSTAEDRSRIFRRSFPPVEATESLAARVRPFLLTGDAIYHSKVFKSLGYLCKHDIEVLPVIGGLRKSWQLLDPNNDDPLGSRVKIYEGTSRDVRGEASNKQLARAWLYADLVHADEGEREAVEAFDLHQRYQAGADLVTAAAMLAIALLNLIQVLEGRGLFSVAPEIMTAEVVPDTEFETVISAMAIGRPGDSVEDLEAALDALHDGSAATTEGD